ncbi:MAG TPA: serine hydrolase domain-containing protein, partial [Polyangiaceae bacterium]|nr:serine hydrolase domain-containing protein [Polyangiaceae bacterium]
LLRVGSVTKTYVAAATLLLVADGAVDLDGTLETWVPGVPNGTTITIRHLLNHTSGVYNYTDITFLQEALADPSRVWTPQELVDIAVQHGADFEPGTDWSYSNTNYILLGMIVEQASGQTVSELMRERLLVAEGLDATFLDGEETLAGDLATGYSQSGNDVTHALNPSAAWAAGSMVATPEDVASWAAALYRGQVLAAPEMEAMLTMVPTGLDGVEYGLGVFGYGPQVLAGHEGIGHGGDIPGFHSIVLYLTDYDAVIVSIVNNDGANPARALANALPIVTAGDP